MFRMELRQRSTPPNFPLSVLDSFRTAVKDDHARLRCQWALLSAVTIPLLSAVDKGL